MKQTRRITIPQFWHELAGAFDSLNAQTDAQGLARLAAHQTVEGRWVITGGNDPIREEWKRLATIASTAMSGTFPAYVKQPRR